MDPQPTSNALYDPTQDERTYATLAHALQMVGTWIAPLVILLAKGSSSKFVKFHAWQALLLQITTFLLVMLFMFGMFATMFATIPMQVEQAQASSAPCDQSPSTTTTPCDEQGGSQDRAPARKRPAQAPFPTAFFLVFPLFWLGYMGWWITMIVLTVLYSIKAGRGEWKGYPLLGRLAARFAGVQFPH